MESRREEFTTCAEDRPLFAQFCANDPSYLLAAAELVQGDVDAIDLNLGCPQRIAKRGRHRPDSDSSLQAMLWHIFLGMAHFSWRSWILLKKWSNMSLK